MTLAHHAYNALRRVAGPCISYRISRALVALKGTR